MDKKTHYKIQIDSLDKRILNILVKDARTPFLEIARECGVSGAAIHQRIKRLEMHGVIKGSEFIVEPLKLGLSTCAYMGIFLEKASMYEGVVKKIQEISEIVECNYTTGKYAIFIKLYAKDNNHLREILTNKLQKIEGITGTETFISLEERFKRQVLVD